MYSFPSASKIREPSPRTMKGGVPPTLRQARTGELTPPGMESRARSKSSRERVWSTCAGYCDAYSLPAGLYRRAVPLHLESARQTSRSQPACDLVFFDGGNGFVS